MKPILSIFLSERYVEGPGLVRLDDGMLVAVVPVVPRNEWSAERRATQSRAHLVRSSDGGKSWQPAAELPYYSALRVRLAELFNRPRRTRSCQR